MDTTLQNLASNFQVSKNVRIVLCVALSTIILSQNSFILTYKTKLLSQIYAAIILQEPHYLAYKIKYTIYFLMQKGFFVVSVVMDMVIFGLVGLRS